MSREEAIKDLKLFIEYANNSNNFGEDYEQEMRQPQEKLKWIYV